MSFESYRLNKSKNYENRPEDGEYTSKITGFYVLADAAKQQGEVFDVAYFSFKLDNGMVYKGRFVLDLREFTLIDALIKATLGEVPDSLDLADLIGLECGLEIKNEDTKKGTYANIKKIFAIEDEESCEDDEEELELEEEEIDVELNLDDDDEEDDMEREMSGTISSSKSEAQLSNSRRRRNIK